MRRMPVAPVVFPKNKHKPRRGRVFAPAARSARLYVTLDPSKVHLFRYLLEAEDNLGLMSVVDRWRAALLVRFSPDQEKAVRDRLEEMKQSLAFQGPFRYRTEQPDDVPRC